MVKPSVKRDEVELLGFSTYSPKGYELARQLRDLADALEHPYRIMRPVEGLKILKLNNDDGFHLQVRLGVERA